MQTERWTWGDPVESLRATVKRGGVLVVPTESSYALAVDPCNQEGVATVVRRKRRAADQPLPVIIAGFEVIADLGLEVPADGLGGLEQAWPGALSILLRCTYEIPAAAGSDYLAVRVPGHERLAGLLRDLGCALTATSANRSGMPPLVEVNGASELVAGEDAMIVDDGRLPGGEPSTMVALGPERAIVVREGRVSRTQLAQLAPQWFSAAPVEIPVEESR
jgi:tRNA threonylcarbamoyl adenosine modification protein (Sua5/YciO/YrdC/YwlC family)